MYENIDLFEILIYLWIIPFPHSGDRVLLVIKLIDCN